MSCEFTRSCEESIRRAPLASVGGAALAAVVVSKLPIGALAGAVLRLAFALVKPALLVLGVLKAAELCRERCGSACPASSHESAIPEAVS